MTDNVLQTLQQLIQDVIAPDVRELKVRLASLEKQNEVRFDSIERQFSAIDKQFASLRQESAVQFKALLAAIGESKAQTELTFVRELSALGQRVAVLEAQRN